MIKVGVTGGIGSGKSLVCKIIESIGYPVYHADIEAKKLSDTQLSVVESITQLFGKDIYVDGKLDRKRVASLVFSNNQMLEKLNAIIHPAVENHFKEWVLKNAQSQLVFQEAAILFESGAYKYVDQVVAVWAPKEIRIRRVAQRDELSVSEIENRMKNQIDEQELLNKSQFVIRNDEVEMLTPQVINIIDNILRKQ